MTKFAVKLIKNTYFSLKIPENFELSDSQYILIRTEKGEEVTKAILVNDEIVKLWDKNPPQEVALIRIMSKKDLEIYEEIKILENESYKKCLDLIHKLNLQMNLVQCRYTFDKRKVTFYYTAPERVDFRELLKELTQIFKKVRIDLRHIGVRDETSLLEGLGLCGRTFCCCSFLRKFESINIKLAKDQGMPITPGKISGTCGRLLCCLNYEYENYMEASKKLPQIGAAVSTPDGLGKVFSLQLLDNKAQVKLENGEIKQYKGDEMKIVNAKVNVEINIPTQNYIEEPVSKQDLKKLEDDRNSSTGNV